ncbi:MULTISPECIES: hypothetical protein [Aneurinibacillus]|uniref:Serine/threonine protein phosphatase PrpC n=1 Tax=Aneurinibacillus thermoaerophilus TaxID=143495 RepID=A0ABX8YAJ1_ANETH|nr:MULTISPECIES: hypothetical protein [Aneurinibacillus]AMA71853.1 hypothetical protein ACH33_02700 [Aneurinibacillus sp. XH2]MED0737270.1 hypothetical protein [Aneurinibacillus thermoaerophilus]MED0757915.1 hypothetical protein [Aneurinibacillus thermoaerophilus]MED0761613.1 hypothetical protein [Aneurinibacillus thermoaerophilus]QYY42380.1 hypothetical protein K3F53_16245 [Aneurinibacillus thermoaerophilus]
MFSFTSDQKLETPITHIYQEPFSFRYGYARAGETQEANDLGQDYLVFRVENKKFTFVLCDGVSLSFCGNIAAQFLATKLIEWLCGIPKEEIQQKNDMTAALDRYLEQLINEATEVVEKHELPRPLSPLLRDVLEEKRRNGSETMFVCGRVDILEEWSNQAHVFLAWSGDLRIRLWDGWTEITHCSGFSVNTQQRWSTKNGLIHGGVNVMTSREVNRPLDRLTLYSDGFFVLDSLDVLPSTDRLQEMMCQSFSSPTSDDISFLDVAW